MTARKPARAIRPGLTAIVTYTPSYGSARALAQLGRLSPAVYSWSTPGGCDQLSATFARPPRFRTDALDPGRIVRAYRGGTVVWEGILDEPAPGAAGWQITAHGAGGWAQDYLSIWTGLWPTMLPDQTVNAAIARGLGWVNPGIGTPAGMWTGQPQDSGAATIADLLNQMCSKGGLTWIVRTVPGGNILSVLPLPTVPNRMLVSGDPAARSVAAGPTTLYVRYQVTWDSASGKNPATYDVTSVTNTALEASTGRREEMMDISSAGVMTAAAAQAVGSQVLKRFTRVSFTDPFTARGGALQTLGGVAVDPGSFYPDGMTGMVCKLLLADYAPAADSPRGQPSFLVGHYEWDDQALTATITPFESMRHDFTSLLAEAAAEVPVRQQPVTTGKKKKKGK